MSQNIAVLSLPIAASGAVNKKRFVTHAGAEAGAATNTLGVACFDADDGEAVTVDVLGTTQVELGGTVTVGAALETDADGKAVAQSAGPTVARALEAGDSGDIIEAILIPN